MVGAPEGGVVAVVGGYHQEVVLAEQGQRLSQLLVKALQLCGVAVRVPSVAP